MGLAVGDALGTTYEFDAIEQPPYPALATGPATDVVGGGPFELPAGAITDDTQMAVCLARSLAARAGVDPEDIAGRYVAWSRSAFDIGNQTRQALALVADGTPARSAGLEVWRATEYRAAGNGSLMRAAPLAVWAALNDAAPGKAGAHDAVKGGDAPNDNAQLADRTIDAFVSDSLITHADPRCVLACVAVDAAIVAAIRGTSAGAGLVYAARSSMTRGAARLREAWRDNAREVELVTQAERDVGHDLDAALSAEPGVYGSELHVHRTAGFVRVALRLAFWHAVHTRTWRDAVVDVASRGGDADTNAAIVGALLGARDGVAAIPAAWLDRVLAATQRGPSAWGDAHHPRHLLAVIDGVARD